MTEGIVKTARQRAGIIKKMVNGDCIQAAEKYRESCTFSMTMEGC